ncbi:MAG: hypothetical protein ACF787_09655, partial [Rhodopirellula sp. JB053]
AWLMFDARKRGSNGIVIAIAFAWLGPLAILGWLALRPSIQCEIRTYSDFGSAEDALEVAANLDMQGDWAKAEDLYRHVADRWPDQMNYAYACIREIHSKRDLADR